MKKIYSFMVAAVAVFGAVACTQELDNNVPEANGETVVFTAYADGADETKTVLNGTNSLWKAGDRIWILNGKEGDAGWKKGFSTTDDEAAKAVFTEEDNSYPLEGTQYFAVYPATAADNATWEGGDVMGVTLKPNQIATVGSYDPAAHIAVAKSETTSLSFKNAVSLLKFTVKNEGVKSVTIYANEKGLLTGSCNISAEGNVTPWTGEGEANGWVELSAGEGTFAVGEEYYVAVFPNTDATNLTKGFTVEFSFDGSTKLTVKSYTEALTLNRNQILDLGEIKYEAPVVHEWAVAGTFNGWSATANPMELVDGYYVAKNITGLNYSDPNEGETGSSTGIKFVVKGTDWKASEGKVTAGTWAYVWDKDAGSNIYVEGATEDLAYDIYVNPSEGDNGKFVIVAAGAVMPEDKPATAQEWYLVGQFNDWTAADPDYKMTLDGDWYVFKNFTADGNALKFVADAGWKINRGGSFIANQAIEVSQDGSDITVTAGTYDVYLNTDATEAYFMNPGLLPGEAPEPDGIYAEEGWVYLKPNSNWTQAGARFAIYFYGNGDTWVSMTKVDGTSYYGVKISDIINKGYTGMIFCRMNPGATANNWDNKWNQTGDLKVSDFTAGKNCFTVASGTWDGATTAWSTVDKLN